MKHEHGSGQSEHQDNHHGHMIADFRKRFWVSLALSIPVLIFSPVIAGFFHLESLSFAGDQYVIFLFATLIYFYGGWPFLSGLYSELKKKQPGMMTLVAVAISVAFFYSAAVLFGLSGKGLLWELVTLVDIMLLGHWIEMKSVAGASRALEELAKLIPENARRLLPGGGFEDVSVALIRVNDNIIIRPGERVPTDAVIIEGETSINQSMITGESKLVLKKIGDEVIGGSINSDGSVTAKITKIGGDTYLSQIIELVRRAQASKSRTQNLANRAAMWLTLIAIGGGLVTLFSWLAFSSEGFGFALERTIAVIVIACPHALGLAIPLVVAFSTSLSARNGLLIRNRDAFENARKIDAVIFDKTGTLTRGEFSISNTLSFDSKSSEQDVLSIAAAVESRSEHSIAKAITKNFSHSDEVRNFKIIAGKGAEATVSGRIIQVLSQEAVLEKGLEISAQAKDLIEQGRTAAFVLSGGALIGVILLDDMLRAESPEAIRQLKEQGMRTIMLTGDNEEVASRVAQEVGVDEYFSEILPDKKAEVVKNIMERGLVVAMVGDGVNDAPALAQADVGIAIGAGTDVAIETADIILARSNPLDVVRVILLARRTYRKMVQNLWWASGYNIVALPLAAGVLAGFGILLSPALGAVFMSLSTVIVAANASLLKAGTI